MSEWIAGFYATPETRRPCTWVAKTLRLSSQLCDPYGVGFTELVDATSPGYAFFTYPSLHPFGAGQTGAPNYERYLLTDSDWSFPIATADWVGILQVCLLGEDTITWSGDPEQMILGFTVEGPSGGPLIVRSSHTLSFLAGDIRIYKRTPYHQDI